MLIPTKFRGVPEGVRTIKEAQFANFEANCGGVFIAIHCGLHLFFKLMVLGLLSE